MKKNIFILLLILPFALNIKAQTDDAKMQVLMKMQTLKTVLLSKDSAGLSALLSDDVTYGHSTGVIQTKSQLIRSMLNGEQDYKSIEPSDINIRIYDNTGVVTVKLKINVVNNGKPLDVNLTAVLIWIKMNGDWKLVARQAVKLPEQQ
jgi:hypothetical protein